MYTSIDLFAFDLVLCTHDNCLVVLLTQDHVFYLFKIHQFRVLQISRRCHEIFSRFCMRLKEDRVENMYLEYACRTDDGEPAATCARVYIYVCNKIIDDISILFFFTVF